MASKSSDRLDAIERALATLLNRETERKEDSKPAKSKESMPDEITVKGPIKFRAILNSHGEVTYHLVKANGQVTRSGFRLQTLKGLY